MIRDPSGLIRSLVPEPGAEASGEQLVARVLDACDAVEKGCCLELDYDAHSTIVEVHAIGLVGNQVMILAWERVATPKASAEPWHLLALAEPRRIEVSGYFSEAPRPGYQEDDPRFSDLICQVELDPKTLSRS